MKGTHGYVSIALTMNFYKSDTEMRKARVDSGAGFGPEGCRQALSGGDLKCRGPAPSNSTPLTGWPAFSSACRHSG